MSISPGTYYTSESFHLVLYFCIFSKSANQNRENTADVSSSQSKLFMWFFFFFKGWITPQAEVTWQHFSQSQWREACRQKEYIEKENRKLFNTTKNFYETILWKISCIQNILLSKNEEILIKFSCKYILNFFSFWHKSYNSLHSFIISTFFCRQMVSTNIRHFLQILWVSDVKLNTMIFERKRRNYLREKSTLINAQ